MKFTKDHEWVRVEGENAVVGITDYAQKALGDIVSLELPKTGAKYKQGQHFSIVDSMKASSEVYAPISGEVVEVNESLRNQPDLINTAAENEGWFFKLKPANLSEIDSLMDENSYKAFAE